MVRLAKALLTIPAAGIWLAGGACLAAPAGLTIEAVNNAQPAEGAPSPDRSGKPNPVIVKAEVLLDRAFISPGVIDGYDGDNVEKALRAFQNLHGLAATGHIDDQTWAALTRDKAPALITYRIGKHDVEGPFVKHIPDKMEDMAKLSHLSYTGPEELLAAKFHMDRSLLEALNPNADFGRAGTEIAVADVQDGEPPGQLAKVVVDKSERAVEAFDADGRLMAFYPATVGSKARPAPSGEIKVHAVAWNPVYYYSPELDFAGVDTDKPFKIAPGPNNPVGTVWIDLEDHYGIHGTPDPDKIGKDFSHGCVRLTNWDAEQLARLVHKGTPVIFVGKAEQASK